MDPGEQPAGEKGQQGDEQGLAEPEEEDIPGLPAKDLENANLAQLQAGEPGGLVPGEDDEGKKGQQQATGGETGAPAEHRLVGFGDALLGDHPDSSQPLHDLSGDGQGLERVGDPDQQIAGLVVGKGEQSADIGLVDQQGVGGQWGAVFGENTDRLKGLQGEIGTKEREMTAVAEPEVLFHRRAEHHLARFPWFG